MKFFKNLIYICLVLFSFSNVYAKNEDFKKQEKWEQMSTEVDHWIDGIGYPIDREIKEIVIALNMMGVKTISSCEGHFDHGFPYPWVDLEIFSAEIEKIKSNLSLKIGEIEREEKLLETKYPDVSFQARLDYPEAKYLLGLYHDRLALSDSYDKAKMQSLEPINRYLNQFYKDRNVSYDRVLIVLNDRGRLQSVGSDRQVIRSEMEQKLKLTEYREEMKAFATFLKKQFMQSNSENNDLTWRVGGKIHFEEESGSTYIGIKDINKFVRNTLRKLFQIESDTCAENAKILVKKGNKDIQITHFEEKSRPGIGEEMHSTLLYTQERGFCDSETLKQVSKNIFDCNESPPSIENVASKYSSIIKPDWEFEISEAVATKGTNGIVFVMLNLLFEGHERIYKDSNPISAGLHMTLVNFSDTIPTENIDLLLEEVNKAFKGKKIKIAKKNGIADLEFGISGTSWRIRAGELWQ